MVRALAVEVFSATLLTDSATLLGASLTFDTLIVTALVVVLTMSLALMVML